jgi:hypothetical protein
MVSHRRENGFAFFAIICASSDCDHPARSIITIFSRWKRLAKPPTLCERTISLSQCLEPRPDANRMSTFA